MVLCDVCGVDMFDADESADLIGLEIKLKFPKESVKVKVHHEAYRVLDKFGKTEFKICFVCWLKSLGVPPAIFRKRGNDGEIE